VKREKEQIEYEAMLKATHHDKPWLPNDLEAEVYGSNRVRMGCPDPGEDLIHRYREVITGASPVGWSDRILLDGFKFEWALADLLACRNCTADTFTEHKTPWKDADGNPIVLRDYYGCRTVQGHGWYLSLHRKRTRESGYPVFVMTNCQGCMARLDEIKRQMRGEDD